MIPTLTIQLYLTTGTDLYGQALLERQNDEKVAPIKLVFGQAHSSVRTDSSGSHGSAMEAVSSSSFLAVAKTKIEIECKVMLMGNPVRVIEKDPRFSVGGRLDHWHIKTIAWA
jgi:hypothetical protein